MASLSKEDLQQFISEVVALRDRAYEQSLEHNGAIKAAEWLLQKLNDSEAKELKESEKEGDGAYSSPSVSLPISGE